MTAVYSRQANPITDWLVQRRRRSLGCGFLANDDGMRPLLNELRAGRSVGLVVDLRVDSGARAVLRPRHHDHAGAGGSRQVRLSFGSGAGRAHAAGAFAGHLA